MKHPFNPLVDFLLLGISSFLLFCFVVCVAPFLLFWYCYDLISIKFGGKK